MKRSNLRLRPIVPLIGSLSLLSSIASVAGVVESDCPQAQLDQVHAHWHILIVERDPGARAQRIREHRELVDSVRQVAETGSPEGGAACEQDAALNHNDLDNMLDMHSMMLDMVE